MCLQTVRGVVQVAVPGGKRVEHLGIKVELIGQIGKAQGRLIVALQCSCALCFALELYYDRGNNYKFTSLVRELEPAGILSSNQVHSAQSPHGLHCHLTPSDQCVELQL